MFDLVSARCDPSNNLVARDQWKFGLRQLAVNDMQIRTANCAGANFNLNLLWAWLRIWQLRDLKSLPRLLQNHCAHG
jgi:hypothetical protein